MFSASEYPTGTQHDLGQTCGLADKHILSCFAVKEVIEGSGGERSGMRADHPANSRLGFLPLVTVMGSITKFTYQVILHYHVMLRDIINMENYPHSISPLARVWSEENERNLQLFRTSTSREHTVLPGVL